jgi:hypothetical protein
VPGLRSAAGPDDWDGGESGLMPYRFSRGRRYWREVNAPPYYFQDEMFQSGPATIPDMKFWFRADGITGLVDTDPVASWTDSSGNGRTATQTTAGRKPTYRTNIQNGKPAVLFDGVDDRMSFTTTGQQSDWSVFLAYRCTDVTTNTLNYVVTQTGSGVIVGGNAAVLGKLAEFQGAGDQIAGTNEPTTWKVVCFQREAIYLNGVAETLTDNQPMTRLDFDTIGGRPDVDNLGLIGYIGEVLDYSRTLDLTEREEVEEYLMTRWGIS